MATEELTIRVSPEAAAIYRNADEQQRIKYDLWISLQLMDFGRPHRPLEQIMDQASAEAKRGGLSPEILQELLNEP